MTEIGKDRLCEHRRDGIPGPGSDAPAARGADKITEAGWRAEYPT